MRYASIIENDMVDSDNGWVVSLWFQGCPHHCLGCHNPETWSFSDGIVEPINAVIQKLEKAIYANNITRNLSILGGEPLCPQNARATEQIVDYFKTYHPEIKIYIWTGYIYENLLKKGPCYCNILNKADVLIDGPFILEQRDITLKLRGSSNQRVIDLQKTKDSHIVLMKN